jgi:hypothetical protein
MFLGGMHVEQQIILVGQVATALFYLSYFYRILKKKTGQHGLSILVDI